MSELYMMLETGKMTEEEFDAAEKLLDRLDAIKEQGGSGKKTTTKTRPLEVKFK